jgi:hypothetical protein
MKFVYGFLVLACVAATVVADDVVTTTTTQTTTSTEVVPSKPVAKDCHGRPVSRRRARKDAVRNARYEVRKAYAG